MQPKSMIMRLNLSETDITTNDKIIIKETDFKDLSLYLDLKRTIFDSKIYSVKWLDYILDKSLNNKCFFFNLDGTQIIGIFAIKYRQNKAYIYDFGLVNSFRGQGMSKKCLSALIHNLKEQGILEVELKVKSNNLIAVNLYKTFGFKLVKEV